ncbi:MAG: transaldolase family protein, partial [Planctomycetota bacterium]
IQTEVMGASFRKVDQILALAGCDLLTIAPDLLESMEQTEGEVPAGLSVGSAKASDSEPLTLEEREFRWLHNQDEMAVDKLADGIRRFDQDARKLEAFALERITGQ